MLSPDIQKDCPYRKGHLLVGLHWWPSQMFSGRIRGFQHRILQKKVKGNDSVGKPSLGATGMPGLHLVCYHLLLMILIIFCTKYPSSGVVATGLGCRCRGRRETA